MLLVDVAPVEVRPYVGAALAADPAGEALLDIGQSGIIGPCIAADGDRVAAAVVGAIDQQAADAAFALEEQELPKVRSFLVNQFTLAQREVC